MSGGNKTALLLGGTGETGKEVLKQLVKSDFYKRIIFITRREVDFPKDSGYEKVEARQVDFDNLEGDSQKFEGADSAFCCIGTTRGKAGKAGFIKVDHDYVLNSAKLLKDSNCPDFHLLTSRGSNANSWFLYPKTKGQVEEAVKSLGFDRLTIYRPGLLMCDRAESRTGEKLIRWVAGWFQQPTSWSIPTNMVAAAIVATSLTNIESGGPSSTILEHSDIAKIAQESSL